MSRFMRRYITKTKEPGNPLRGPLELLRDTQIHLKWAIQNALKF